MAKEEIIRMKRLLEEWKKISASYGSDKRLVSIIYKELKNLNSQRKKKST
jgi:hypothetical protein